MKRTATIYFFISFIIMNLFFNIPLSHLTMYAVAAFVVIMSSDLVPYTWFGFVLTFFYKYSYVPYLFYAILGFVIFIFPLMQDDTLKEKINKDFLSYTYPFYLLITSSIYVFFNPGSSISFYYLFTLLMFINSKNLATFIILGFSLLFTSYSVFSLGFYLLGYFALVGLSEKIKNNYDITKSNVSYDGVVVVNDNKDSNIKNKTNTLNELITELSLLKSNIIDKNVRKSIDEVLEVCEKIKANVDTNNEYKVNKLINYYAPELINIIKDYIDVEKVDVVSEENLMFKVNVMRIIDKSKEAFHKILQSLIDTTIKKSNIDIKVLEKMLKEENLL